jgi:hypothetical protein
VKSITLVPRVGVNEWIWTNTAGLSAGTYLYRINVKKNGQELTQEEGVKTTGKVVLVK